MTANAQKLNPAQRAMLFSQATRQNRKSLPAISTTENTTVQFNLPKVRLGSRIYVLVEATAKVTHATATSYTPAPFAPFTLLRRASVDINNGFSPFSVAGRELAMTEYARDNAGIMAISSSANRGKTQLGLVASSGGTNNKVQFLAELPLALNQRDPVGLVLLQNEETVVTVTLDIQTLAAALLPQSATGYTVALIGNITITPVVETFSIPAVQDAFPDISVLKLVNKKIDTISGAGQFTQKLPVGTTYRKLFLYFEDTTGVPFLDSDFTGDIELVFNQSDIPYSINPKVLSTINQQNYGTNLPDGLYAFDFTFQGLANYGGARDYIDTEKLTEFWVRFNAPRAGQVTAVYETLSRLRQA